MNPPEDQPADLQVWNAVLDRIEQSIRAVDPDGLVELDAEFEAIGGFEPPEAPRAMPEALLERAQALLEAVNATAERVARAQHAIGDELADQAKARRRPVTDLEPPAPSLVDHDA